jgi:hydroxymethylbilane synthase
MLPRADVRDRLIGAASLEALPPAARVGTSSPRRAAQLRSLRSDLIIVPLRGNVATRLAKIADGAADATLLAAAGLDRLGIDVGAPLPLDLLLPAPAQGAVGVTVREGDSAVTGFVAAIDHAATSTAVMLERGFLAALDADCHSSVAALALVDGGEVHIRAEILLPDGSERHGGARTLAVPYAGAAVIDLAAELLDAASPALRGLFGRG